MPVPGFPYLIDGGTDSWDEAEQDWADADAGRVFECEHCGDGDALRSGEACAYCGTEAESESDYDFTAADLFEDFEPLD